MSVPPKHRTKGKVRRRRSHDALETKTLAICPKCGKAILPHTVCSFCGSYRDRQILTIKAKTKKKKE
jgi:large subunit ribosomal protein L32